MKTIIIEDEKPAARRLQRLLQQLNVQVDVLLHSVEESVNWFKSNEHPHLIFLDIQLSDGLSFEIFEQIYIKSAIIFTTAYDEYALKAFKLNSIDYLLKPIATDELAQAITKYKNNTLLPSNLNINFEEIKKLLINPIDRKYKKRFTIKIGQHLKIITATEIECFYAQNKATYLHTTTNRSYLLEGTLEYWYDQLNPEYFYKVNRTFVVHIHAIKDIISYSNSRLKILLNSYCDTEIIVSRERVKDFKTWIS